MIDLMDYVSVLFFMNCSFNLKFVLSNIFEMSQPLSNTLNTWVEVPKNSDFTIYNLPFGVFQSKKLSPRIGIAIGDKIVDLSVLDQEGFFASMFLPDGCFLQNTLNDLIALGKVQTRKIRERVQELLLAECELLRDHQSRGKAMVNRKEAEMLMPVKVNDFCVFSGNEQHLINLQKISRSQMTQMSQIGQEFPIGYSGRASSIIPSGTPITRPKGQFKNEKNGVFTFESSSKLDFEVSMGFIVGKSSKLGDSVAVEDAEDYIFGFVLHNGWTARDIQESEGGLQNSFSSKNFGASISNWVVCLEALEPFRTNGINQNLASLPYLKTSKPSGFDIQLKVFVQPEGKATTPVTSSNFNHVYWTPVQQLAQLTSNGAALLVGDLICTGAISGKSKGSFGSLLELTEGGLRPIQLESDESRGFLEDGDTVILRGHAVVGDIRVGFGEISTQILATK